MRIYYINISINSIYREVIKDVSVTIVPLSDEFKKVSEKKVSEKR